MPVVSSAVSATGSFGDASAGEKAPSDRVRGEKLLARCFGDLWRAVTAALDELSHELAGEIAIRLHEPVRSLDGQRRETGPTRDAQLTNPTLAREQLGNAIDDRAVIPRRGTRATRCRS